MDIEDVFDDWFKPKYKCIISQVKETTPSKTQEVTRVDGAKSKIEC